MTRVARSDEGEPNFKPPKADKPARKPMRRQSKKKQAYRASAEGIAALDHMGKVRLLPCCICENYGMRQTSPTEAHHCKSGRYGTLRENDRCTIPLCKCHHQGLLYNRDRNKLAYHQGQETWEAAHGPDHQYIAATLDAVEALT